MENQISKIKPADRLASVSEYYFSKKLKEVAQKYNVSIWTLLCNLNKVPGMVSAMTAAKLTHFRQLIEGFTEIAKEENAFETTYRVA